MSYYCEDCIHVNNCDIKNEQRKIKCVWFEKCKLKGQYVKPRWKKQTWKYANTVRCEKCLFYETNSCPKQNKQKESSKN